MYTSVVPRLNRESLLASSASPSTPRLSRDTPPQLPFTSASPSTPRPSSSNSAIGRSPVVGDRGSNAVMSALTATGMWAATSPTSPSTPRITRWGEDSAGRASTPVSIHTRHATGSPWASALPRASSPWSTTTRARSPTLSRVKTTDSEFLASGAPSSDSERSAVSFTRSNSDARVGMRPPSPTISRVNSAKIPASPVAPVVGMSSPKTPVSSRATLSQFVSTYLTKQQENAQCYKEGGYMAVVKGNVLNRRFEVISKLGWGEFSTVWLVHDRQATTPELAFLAMKVAKCSPTVTATTKYEAKLLQYARDCGGVADFTGDYNGIANICHVFEHTGQFGMHLCFTMPVYGSNMLCIIDQVKVKRSRRSDAQMTLVKDVCIGVLKSLAALESINVLHTDLKPENVLCTHPDPNCVSSVSQFLRSRGLDNEAQDHLLRCFSKTGRSELDSPVVTLADFGLALLLEPDSSPGVRTIGGRRDAKIIVEQSGVLRNSHGILIQTREYRAPEVLLGMDFNCRTDVWSLGCMAFELITGQFLMDPKRKTRVEREMDVEHLLMMMQLIGSVPARMMNVKPPGRRMRYQSRYFDENGVFLHQQRAQSYPRRNLVSELEVFTGEGAEAQLAAQFILSCFSFDPFERCHASDLLQHPWLSRSR